MFWGYTETTPYAVVRLLKLLTKTDSLLRKRVAERRESSGHGEGAKHSSKLGRSGRSPVKTWR